MKEDPLLHNISHATEITANKRIRLYVRIIRKLGVKEGLYIYNPPFLVRIVRVLFFFGDRLREFLYWRGVFIKEGDKYVLNTPKNRKRIEMKERLDQGKYHSGMD